MHRRSARPELLRLEAHLVVPSRSEFLKVLGISRLKGVWLRGKRRSPFVGHRRRFLCTQKQRLPEKKRECVQQTETYADNQRNPYDLLRREERIHAFSWLAWHGNGFLLNSICCFFTMLCREKNGQTVFLRLQKYEQTGIKTRKSMFNGKKRYWNRIFFGWKFFFEKCARIV